MHVFRMIVKNHLKKKQKLSVLESAATTASEDELKKRRKLPTEKESIDNGEDHIIDELDVTTIKLQLQLPNIIGIDSNMAVMGVIGTTI